MNKKEDLCALVQDVLPVYVDGLVSRETRNAVKEHLRECETCRSMYEKMSQQLPIREPSEETLEMIHSAPEIDYLKKVKKRGRKRMLSLAFGLVLVFTVCIVWQRYGHGTATEEYSADMAIEEENVKIQGEVKKGKAYSHFAVREKEGISHLVIYEAEPSFWHSDSSFAITIPLEQAKENGLVAAAQKISASGELIEEKTQEIYANKHPYIGDMPKNSALAQALEIDTELGRFTNELQTDKEPYGWLFTFKKAITGTTDELVFNEKMKGFACVLFACIDNLGEVSWSYILKNESEPADKPEKCGDTNQKLERFTVAKASDFLGQDVKGFGESEEKLQELLKLAGVLPGETTLSFSEEYPYRKVLHGTMPNAKESTTFVVLTRNKDVTFEQVWRSVLSSNSADWLDNTEIVDVY